jgi:hypothetical protein
MMRWLRHWYIRRGLLGRNQRVRQLIAWDREDHLKTRQATPDPKQYPAKSRVLSQNV